MADVVADVLALASEVLEPIGQFGDHQVQVAIGANFKEAPDQED